MVLRSEVPAFLPEIEQKDAEMKAHDKRERDARKLEEAPRERAREKSLPWRTGMHDPTVVEKMQQQIRARRLQRRQKRRRFKARKMPVSLDIYWTH